MNADQAALADRLSRALRDHRDVVGRARDCIESPNRGLIRAVRLSVKTAKADLSRCYHEALQAKLNFSGMAKAQAMIAELAVCDAALVEAFEAADDVQHHQFLRCLVNVLTEAVGEEQRRAWMTEAGRRQRLVEEKSDQRRAVATNAINMGTTGGMRTRRNG